MLIFVRILQILVSDRLKSNQNSTSWQPSVIRLLFDSQLKIMHNVRIIEKFMMNLPLKRVESQTIVALWKCVVWAHTVIDPLLLPLRYFNVHFETSLSEICCSHFSDNNGEKGRVFDKCFLGIVGQEYPVCQQYTSLTFFMLSSYSLFEVFSTVFIVKFTFVKKKSHNFLFFFFFCSHRLF